MKTNFSIVIPVYNVAPYLRQCLDSVLAQTMEDWEAICVDDGSTDDSGKILDEYNKFDGRIRVIHQSNSGVSAARNKALDIAQGEWIIFIDSDDYVDSRLLEEISRRIDMYKGIDCVAFCATEFSDIAKTELTIHTDATQIFNTGDEVLGCFRRNAYGRFVHCIWDKAYRRSVLENNRIRFPVDVKLAEDSHFAQMFLLICGSVCANLVQFGYYYRHRNDSLLRNINQNMLTGVVELFRLKYEAWLKHPSKGFTMLLARFAAALPMLGNGTAYRAQCIELLLNSVIVERSAVPFLLKYGSIKGRLFAYAYLLLPSRIKRMILKSIS